jgi:glycerol-3-phosphate dehydrogenase (NAD(P)+)
MKIGVIGAGSWGTTLADLLAKRGYAVTLWAYEKDLVERMRQTHKNDNFLSGFTLDKRLSFTADLAEAAAGKDLLVLVAPSQVMRSVLEQAAPHISPDTLLVSAAKGIENNTLMLMSEVLEEVLPPEKRQQVAYISGPTFAREVAAEIPTALAVASRNQEVAREVQEIFSCKYFRLYRQDDVIGVELGFRRPRLRLQYPGRFNHPRSGGDDPHRPGQRGQGTNLLRPGRHGRSGVDLYRRSVPQPFRRPGTRSRS